MKDLFDSYDRSLIHSTPGVRTDLFRRPLDQVKITDFFGNVQSVEIGSQGETIDEDLLTRLSNVSVPLSERNESEVVLKKDSLDVGGHGYDVKLQQGNVWMKTGAVIVCIILWIAAKQL
jgi:GPI-anchor transamidase subunit K